MCELLKWEGTDELESEQMANAALIASRSGHARGAGPRRDALIQEMLEALKGVSERQSFPTNSYPWWRAVQGAIRQGRGVAMSNPKPRAGQGGGIVESDALIACVVVLSGVLLIVLFGGDPDLHDALIHWLMS